MAADLPVVEVADVGAVTENLDAPLEQALEVGFELVAQPGDDVTHIIAVRVGDEDVKLVWSRRLIHKWHG
jgi:hypothetical protein